jgi:hypothetical protein
VNALAERVDAPPPVAEREPVVIPARPLESPRALATIVRPLKLAATAEKLAEPTASAATDTLREALATAEGREQLKAAMEVIAEQRRQERLVSRVERSTERDQRWKDRITKNVSLAGDEPLKVQALFTTLEGNRRQVIEDMKAGLKNSEQADKELDDLYEGAQKDLHGLLGDERWRKLRESERRGGRGAPQAPAPGAGG